MPTPPVPDPRHVLGRAGELAAASWLRTRGLTIVARNVRTRGGELDLVARDGETLVFAEVKTRRPSGYGEPGEAVDARKRARLVRAAASYLRRFGDDPPACRFDVIEVLAGPGGEPEVRHHPDAFRPGWS